MSVSAPSRRLLLSLSRRPQLQYPPTLPLCQHHRTIFGFGRKKERNVIDPTNPEFLKDAKKQGSDPDAQVNSGKLASSIFDTYPSDTQLQEKSQKGEKRRVARELRYGREEKEREERREKEEAESKAPEPLDYRNLKPTVQNPNPKAHIRWVRKMVIRDIRGRHRLNKTEKILKTERFHHAKSPFIKTSIKKLGPLARQIAGKPVDEALIQMRFSKKKAALDVLKHLRYAKNQAIVSKQMGLGKDIAPGLDRSTQSGEKENAKIVVEDKKGKRRTVTDRSALYVDEAWVGRGTYGFDMDYRARGRGNRLRLPYTSISIVLKEEATRIRQQEEREQKRLKKKVWVPLPDRPVTAQRQYPLW